MNEKLYRDKLIKFRGGDLSALEDLLNYPGFIAAVAKVFTEYKEEVMNFVLSNPAEFKRAIPTTEILKLISKLFSNHEVLKKSTVDEVMDALKSRSTARQAAKILSQDRYGTSMFGKLPHEINKKIVMIAAEHPAVCEEKETREIINTYYSP